MAVVTASNRFRTSLNLLGRLKVNKVAKLKSEMPRPNRLFTTAGGPKSRKVAVPAGTVATAFASYDGAECAYTGSPKSTSSFAKGFPCSTISFYRPHVRPSSFS